MPKKTNASPPVRLMSFIDCASVIGLPLDWVQALIAEFGYKVLTDPRKMPAISHCDFVLLANERKVREAADTAARYEALRRRDDIESGKEDWYRAEIQTKIAEYRRTIQLIADLHAKYLNRVDTDDRTGTTAAYLLYSRAINLLNMCCASLEAGFWNGGLLLRQIDETIQVCEYFSCCGRDPRVQREIAEWFRQDRTPEPQAIRVALARHHEKEYGADKDGILLFLMADLYKKKSKWVHPAYGPIRETMRVEPTADGVSVTGFDYAACTDMRKMHELVDFFRSSVWSVVQIFSLAFHVQLRMETEDFQTLLRLNDEFARRSSSA